ncbi:MAG: hypothetical protein Q9220_001820 [cf. Caloplaca sp. 1 TL-2023]
MTPALGLSYNKAYQAFKEEKYSECLDQYKTIASDFSSSSAMCRAPYTSPGSYYKHHILPRAVLYWKASMLRHVFLPYREYGHNIFSSTAGLLYENVFGVGDILQEILGEKYPMPNAQGTYDLSILESQRFFDDVLEEELLRTCVVGSYLYGEAEEARWRRAGFIEASEELQEWRKEYLKTYVSPVDVVLKLFNIERGIR